MYTKLREDWVRLNYLKGLVNLNKSESQEKRQLVYKTEYSLIHGVMQDEPTETAVACDWCYEFQNNIGRHISRMHRCLK